MKKLFITVAKKKGGVMSRKWLTLSILASLLLVFTSSHCTAQSEGLMDAVDPHCPHAVIGGPYNGFINVPIILDASQSWDPDNDPIVYEWDLDNDGLFGAADNNTFGFPSDAVGMNPQWTWHVPFTGVITLRVIDFSSEFPSCTDTSYTTVSIGNHAPTSDPDGPYTASQGSCITLDGSGSFDVDPGDVITYEWDLDNDGIFDDCYNIHCEFCVDSGGPVGSVYSVCLKVTDSFGLSNTKCTTCTIESLIPTGVLQGTVIDAATSLPISGVSVSAVGPLTGSATTDAAGFYSFPVLSVGTYNVSANKTGYITETASVVIADGFTTVQDFALTIETISIHDIQGASHISPKNGQLVSTKGIVTAKRTNGFYMQDPNPDADATTSEAIFVFTSLSPTVAIGDMVMVTGTVKEFRPGGASSTNLTTTELDNPGRTITVLSSGNPLPAPVIIGSGGRIPPAMVIEDDATGDVETSGVFDPANDGIDFYESLEGMLVQVNDAVAVGPTRDFGSNREIAVVGDNGANASVRTNRGGLVISANDFNPERIILNDLIAGGPILPPVNVGDTFLGTTVGVIDYSFGNFKLQVVSLPPLSNNGLQKEITTPAGTNKLAVATFNVANLAPTDPPSKFAEMANLIVNNLKSPDVLGIEVLQDNTGAIDNGVVDATLTWNILIAAIQVAGGPTYNYRQIDPVNDQDGGVPGGNIRQGFLFRTDRGLSFVDRLGGNSISANAVVSGTTGPELLFSPGRIDPINPAFNSSRKPLAGEFVYHGDKVFIIANHFNTKAGDQPLYGHLQPPILASETQRILQAQIVNSFVNSILVIDPDANVIVLGDLNDYEFSLPLAVLKGAVLNNLIETLPQSERYTYVFDGNSQVLDHILVSNRLFNAPLAFDVVHVNSEFVVQASDHDPLVAQLCAERIPPQVQIVVPQLNAALQDGVTFAATASDAGGIDKVFFYVREPDGGTGTPIGYEDLAAPYNSATGYWEYPFDTTKLQDGYYVILVKAIDKCGNEAWSQVTAFSIRNWAVIVLLPATPNNKAGRTMPVKFSIRIAASVDPSMPFVYNEDLEIRIYRCDNTSCSSKTLMQTSTYGTGSKDYRINGELYITNFQTQKTPAQYLVEIWRPSNNFMVGSFTFKTVK